MRRHDVYAQRSGQDSRSLKRQTYSGELKEVELDQDEYRVLRNRFCPITSGNNGMVRYLRVDTDRPTLCSTKAEDVVQ